MKLYLVRHADPTDPMVDSSRPITVRGMKDIEKVGRHLSGMRDIIVGKIFHSGRLRALQTAEILQECLGPGPVLSEERGLGPADDPSIWLDRLDIFEENIMIVGHMPFLAKMEEMLSGTAFKPFKTAEISCLEGTNGNWSKRWRISPEDIES